MKLIKPFSKTILMFFLFQTICLSTYSQQVKAKNYIDSIFLKMLVDDGILVDSVHKEMRVYKPYWKNKTERNKYLKSEDGLKAILLNTYFQPNLTSADVIKNTLIFKDRNIGFIGSTIIKKDNLNDLNTFKLPLLPILGSQDQLSILNPDASNYKLNMTAKSVFNNNGQISANLQNPVVSAKAAFISTIKDDDMKALNIGVGIFKNYLANVFDNIKLLDFKPKDFAPLYFIWNLYKSNDIENGDKCIRSFRGFCYSLNHVQHFSSDISFSSSVDAKGVFPILSLGGNDTVNWVKNQTSMSTLNNYNVIMFDNPDLVAFPSKNVIKSVWNNLTNKLKVIPLPADNKIFTLPVNGDLSIPIVFGPIPDANILHNIVIDTDYTFRALGKNKSSSMISGISLNTDDNVVKPLNDNYYSLQLTFKGNSNFFSTVDTISFLDVPIRLYLDNNIDNDTLDVKYLPVKIYADNKPLPFLAEDKALQFNREQNSVYSYSTVITIDRPNDKFKLLLTGKDIPQIVEIPSLSISKTNLSKSFISSCSISANGAVDNSVKLNISLDSTLMYDYFSTGNSLTLKMQFKDQNTLATTYRKPITISFSIPPEIAKGRLQKQPTGTIAFSKNNELIDAIDTSLRIVYGLDSAKISFGNVLKNLKGDDGKLANLQLIDIIKQNTDLIVSPSYQYIISSKYLKKENL